MSNVIAANFAYGAAENSATLATLAVFADRPALRAELAEDAALAGFRVDRVGDSQALVADDPGALGDVLLFDCPEADAGMLAALARLDCQAARGGTQLVVSTTLGALDGVFGCLDQSEAQILIEPTRGERVVALGRVMARLSLGGVRELSEEDRLTLLRLTEQVGQIAQQLDRLGGGQSAAGAPVNCRTPAPPRRLGSVSGD